MLHYERSVEIHAPVEAVFAFHERPDALQKLTPPSQLMEVISRTGGIETGARVEFRIHFGPLSQRWVALHADYRKNRLFEDVQVEGPFHSWRHQHRFEPANAGTLLTDHIDFELPGGRLVELACGWFAVAQLDKLFDYRHRVTKQECERK